MRRSRAKKEKEQAQLQGGETGGEAAATTAVPNGPGYHIVPEHEEGISNSILQCLRDIYLL